MMSFPTVVTWGDIALRLCCTLAAGLLIGWNRDETGRPAGLRTTVLVTLAASVAMIEANLLLPTEGKASGSFANIDVMRLPLGILSGIGFLGAGAIIRRDDRVMGLTTAATLWLTTVIGLCIGGGQIALGVVTTAMCYCVLWLLKLFQERGPQNHRSALVLSTDEALPIDEVMRLLKSANLHVTSHAQGYKCGTVSKVSLDLNWRSPLGDVAPPAVIDTISKLPGVKLARWTPKGMSP